MEVESYYLKCNRIKKILDKSSVMLSIRIINNSCIQTPYYMSLKLIDAAKSGLQVLRLKPGHPTNSASFQFHKMVLLSKYAQTFLTGDPPPLSVLGAIPGIVSASA